LFEVDRPGALPQFNAKSRNTEVRKRGLVDDLLAVKVILNRAKSTAVRGFSPRRVTLDTLTGETGGIEFT
jgi:hypothetical protein